MSKITSIFDAMVTRVSGVLTDHARLTDPYNIEQNTDLTLEKAFGVAVLDGVNTERNLSCQLSVQRTVQVSIARRYSAHELDIISKDDTVKALLEDHFLVVDAFEEEPTLGSLVAKGAYSSDSGIIFIRDNEPFLAIQTNFLMEYFEDLTA